MTTGSVPTPDTTRYSIRTRMGIVAFFALATIIFFWRILFTSGVYFPPGGDFVSFNYPQNVFAAHSLQNGEIPLWNPYVMTGQPYAADPNVGFFYPVKLLLMLVLPGFTYQEMEFLLIFHYFLSGLFTFALARDLGASQSGGIVAGLAFMFSGFMIAQLEHPNIIITATWLPLVFLFFRRAILCGHVADALLSAIFLTISIFGGHQQFSILMVFWMLLWLVGYWIAVNRSAIGRDLRNLLWLLMVTLATSAIQILPTVELISQSIRGQLSAAEAAAVNLPPVGWITLLLPHFFGANNLDAQSLWNGYGNWNEAYGYVGVITLFLAIVGWVLRMRNPDPRARYEGWFLASMALLALVLAAGDVTPLFSWVHGSVPILQFLRVPARYIFWFDLSVPLLAGLGMDFFLRSAPARRSLDQVLVIIVALLFAAAALGRSVLPSSALSASLDLFLLLVGGLGAALIFHLRLRRLRGLLIALVLALLSLDLLAAQGTLDFTTHDPLADFRRSHGLAGQVTGDLYRLDAAPPALVAWQPLSGLVDPVLMAFGLPWNPFDLTAFRDYWDQTDPETRFYDFVAVKYLIAPTDAALSGKWLALPSADPEFRLFENATALPRAFVVSNSIVEPERARALDLIQRQAFDPRTTVLLESGLPVSGSPVHADAPVISSTNNSVTVQVTAPHAAYLVLSDTYYPGWRVWIDGRAAELLRANYTFRAVALDAGEHIVRFSFEPFSWQIGLAVSVSAWTLLASVGLAKLAGSLRRGRSLGHGLESAL